MWAERRFTVDRSLFTVPSHETWVRDRVTTPVCWAVIGVRLAQPLKHCSKAFLSAICNKTGSQLAVHRKPIADKRGF